MNPLQSYLDTVETRVEKATPGRATRHDPDALIAPDTVVQIAVLWDAIPMHGQAHSDLTKLLAICRELREALEKVADPTKRGHKEPDAYTTLGCVMNIADEALARAGEMCMKIKEQ